MSVITEALVLGANDAQMNALNHEIHKLDTAREQSFKRIDMDAAGGSKWFCEEVWAAAFNYFGSDDEIREAVDRAWDGPLYGVVIIAQCRYSDTTWHIVVAPKDKS